MNTSFKKIRRIVAAIAIPAIATLATASAQTQQNNQLALQLGAIQLGYTTNATWYTNAQLLGNALIQGQQALLATTTNKYTSYVGTTNGAATNAPTAQTATFRDQLYLATLAALNSPVTNTNKYTTTNTIKVTVVNGKTGKQTTNSITSFGLNPALTTPTAVLALVSPRVPNLDPGLISNAVAASFAYTIGTNGVYFPIWGAQPAVASVKAATNANNLQTLNIKTGTAQLNNAGAVAAAAMTATLKNYAPLGTKQWAGYTTASGPITNPATVYLPNYSTKAIGPVSNLVQPNLPGLADAAAAVSASAINGLGGANTNRNGVASLYGKSAPNVQTISQKLITAANAFQATSVYQPVNQSFAHYQSGALGAVSLGLISQVAGDQNEFWGASSSTFITPVLNGVVAGAVKALGKTSVNLASVATGIAQGFAVAYLETYFKAHPDTVNFQPDGLTGFVAANITTGNIFTAFSNAGVSSTTTLAANIKSALSAGISNAYQAFGWDIINNQWSNTYGTWNIDRHVAGSFPISGAIGINLAGSDPLVNGVGTPVTDTLGQ